MSKVCKKDKNTIDEEEYDEDVEFMGVTTYERKWLGDMGASVHVTDNEKDFHNAKKFSERVKVGGGHVHQAKAKGNEIVEINGK